MPLESLANFDAGPLPEGLTNLTLVEEVLLATNRVHRYKVDYLY